MWLTFKNFGSSARGYLVNRLENERWSSQRPPDSPGSQVKAGLADRPEALVSRVSAWSSPLPSSERLHFGDKKVCLFSRMFRTLLSSCFFPRL